MALSHNTRVNILIGNGHFLSHFYVLCLPPMFVAQFAMGPCAATVLASPKRLVAKFKTDPEAVVAEDFAPTTTAAPSSPSAWATAAVPLVRSVSSLTGEWSHATRRGRCCVSPCRRRDSAFRCRPPSRS